MKVSRQLQNLLTRALSESMNSHTMEKLARRVFADYDLHERSGYPPNIPITSITGAAQITMDMIEEEVFTKFIAVLIDVYQNGLMGRKINIKLLPQLIGELESQGLVYNPEYGIFTENRGETTSKGWRVLEEGKTYEFSFLRIDIVKNSELVRKYSKDAIMRTYADIREIVKHQVEKRDGRIWGWEGDGGIAAFYLNRKNIDAVLCGLRLLLKLFLYNLFECRLEEPIRVRIAIHTGPCQYFNQLNKVQNDTIRKLEIIESQYTLPDSMTLSAGVYSDLGGKFEKLFQAGEAAGGMFLYRFKLRWEE